MIGTASQHSKLASQWRRHLQRKLRIHRPGVPSVPSHRTGRSDIVATSEPTVKRRAAEDVR